MRLYSFVRSGAIAALTLCLAASPMFAQATTGNAAGVISQPDGAPITGATVVFTYEPTNFTSTATTNDLGAFRLQGLEPGGPYTVEVSSLGYRSATRENVSIALGQTYRLSLTLEPTAVELEALLVETDALASQFSPSTQGSSTTINQQQLESLPTLDRRFENLARLTPQIVATDESQGLGLSVVGQNNRFNTIQIDGATVNDRFGLGDTGTAGGQAQGKPIGFGAVKEFQVLLSPYDVRQGNFTGALINAVTKSGGNEFFGDAFGLFRNEGLAGDPLGENEFKRWQYGASLGGPIARDKAFFFVNAEIQSASRPASGPYAGAGAGVSGLVPDATDLSAMNAALQSYGLAAGDASAATNENPLINITARTDVNLNEQNRLVFRYTFNRAEDDVFGRSSSTGNPDFRFVNNGYQFVSKSHNPSVQLFTNFANGNSNEFRLSYNRIRDARDPNVVEPNVTVNGFDTSIGCPDPSCAYGIETGSEQFSQGNRLNQDIWEITNNYTFAPMGEHTFTVGARAELYKVFNLFAQSSFGVYNFDQLSDFEDGGAGSASRYTVSGSIQGGPVPAAEFNSQQFGVYAQDQWQATEKFSLNVGLRADIPVFGDQPTYAAQVNTDFGNPEVPSGQIMLNPRLGFNWDLTTDTEQQLRGGIGMFTGNPAYVWMSNAYSNNGTGIAILSCGNTNPNGLAPAFNPDVDNQSLTCAPGTADGGGTVGIGSSGFLGEIDLIGQDTKFPRVLRANLAYDRRINEDLLFTLEGIYNRGLNDYFIVNRNLGNNGIGQSTTTDSQGRVLYGTIDDDGFGIPNYYRPEFYGTGSVGVFELLNTNNNYSYNITASLQKLIGDDLRLTGAYTYSKSKDVQSFTSSRATSNWRFGRMNAGDQLIDNATTSSFDRTHKITMSGTYSLPFSEDFPTDLSLIYIGNSGLPFTYISGGFGGRGDLNADGIVFNDPLYVIEGPGDPGMTWASPEDAQAYDALIAAQPCLADQRGTITERNVCRNPWQNFLDMSISQGFPEFSGGQRIKLELGVYNVLNLLNSDWGVIETAGGGVFDSHAIAFVSGGDDVTGDPVFVYLGPEANPDEGITLEDALYDPNGDPRSSWQLQLQLRYEF